MLESNFEFLACLLVMCFYPTVTMQIRYLFDPSVLQASLGRWWLKNIESLVLLLRKDKQTLDALFIFFFPTGNLFEGHILVLIRW